MIEFRCPGCGKGLRADESHAGATGKCVACGRAVQIPKPPAAKGIRIDEGGLGAPIESGQEGASGVPPRASARCTGEEGYCRIWRAGELPPRDNPEHQVADISQTGLRVILGGRSKRKTLAHAASQLWAVGDDVELDLMVGAYASPLRLYAKVMRVESAGLSKGTELGLQITEADGDTYARLRLLEQREDLRQRRKRDAFNH
jgi:hypothetical protein